MALTTQTQLHEANAARVIDLEPYTLTNRQVICMKNLETLDLNDIIDQMSLTD